MSVLDAFRTNNTLLGKVHVTNTDNLMADEANAPLQDLLEALDLHRDRRIELHARFKLPWFMAQHVDVVLSHQWHNELNFLYFDVMHSQFPLVHNSPFLKDCGYYYEGEEVEQAVAALTAALLTHDNNLESYAKRVRTGGGTGDVRAFPGAHTHDSA